MFVISQTDRRPMYLQIMEQIKQRIAVGDWAAGQAIPSIRQLAVDIGVSVITVKRAYLELEREGVIVTRQGKGCFVTSESEVGTQIRERELAMQLEHAVEAPRCWVIGAGFRETNALTYDRVTVSKRSLYESERHELEGVCKSYRYFTLQNIALQLPCGTIMGLIGPNGAGKSTTIRILMGLVHQDRGEVRVLGHRMPDEQVAAKWDIGFASEDMRLYECDDTGLAYAIRQSNLSDLGRAYAQLLLKRFGLTSGAKDQRTFARAAGESGAAAGIARRRPKLLVLDEPTTGLDPVARHEILHELRR